MYELLQPRRLDFKDYQTISSSLKLLQVSSTILSRSGSGSGGIGSDNNSIIKKIRKTINIIEIDYDDSSGGGSGDGDMYFAGAYIDNNNMNNNIRVLVSLKPATTTTATTTTTTNNNTDGTGSDDDIVTLSVHCDSPTMASIILQIIKNNITK